jgi:hypothetical protein
MTIVRETDRLTHQSVSQLDLVIADNFYETLLPMDVKSNQAFGNDGATFGPWLTRNQRGKQ